MNSHHQQLLNEEHQYLTKRLAEVQSAIQTFDESLDTLQQLVESIEQLGLSAGISVMLHETVVTTSLSVQSFRNEKLCELLEYLERYGTAKSEDRPDENYRVFRVQILARLRVVVYANLSDDATCRRVVKRLERQTVYRNVNIEELVPVYEFECPELEVQSES